MYWDNNSVDGPDSCVLFHRGNWAKSFIPTIEIKATSTLGTAIGEENTYGTMAHTDLTGIHGVVAEVQFVALPQPSADIPVLISDQA